MRRLWFLFSLLLRFIGAADDWPQFGPFIRMEHENPVLEPRRDTTFLCPMHGRSIRWEEKDVFNPSAVVKDGKVHLIYRAEDTVGNLAGTSRLGLAVSQDGVEFDAGRRPEPILFPDHDVNEAIEWQGGLEDPRVVQTEEGGYVMTYTSYDGTARLCIATSPDLLSWTKHGPAFKNAFGGEFGRAWTKSGAIVCRLVGSALVATKLNGKYWMYWGENNVHAAASDDLINWEPILEDHPGGIYRGRPDHQDAPVHGLAPFAVFGPRRGSFDSDLVEPGPPAVITPVGILFIYNSKNKWCDYGRNGKCERGENDATIPPGTYSAGQVLLSLEDPTRVLHRTDHSFFKPEMQYEKTGQVANVCFLEGLVYHRGEWLLYYGTADSKIAVAKWPDPTANVRLGTEEHQDGEL